MVLVIEKLTEFPIMMTMNYEVRYKCGIKHCCDGFICASLSLLNILLLEYITFLFGKLSCAAEILMQSDAVNFLTKSLGIPYSVLTAHQGCSTEMVNTFISHLPENKYYRKNITISTSTLNNIIDC